MKEVTADDGADDGDDAEKEYLLQEKEGSVPILRALLYLSW